MDKKRNKHSSKHITHVKRVLKERMKECYVTGKSLEFSHLNVKLHQMAGHENKRGL